MLVFAQLYLQLRCKCAAAVLYRFILASGSNMLPFLLVIEFSHSQSNNTLVMELAINTISCCVCATSYNRTMLMSITLHYSTSILLFDSCTHHSPISVSVCMHVCMWVEQFYLLALHWLSVWFVYFIRILMCWHLAAYKNICQYRYAPLVKIHAH